MKQTASSQLGWPRFEKISHDDIAESELRALPLLLLLQSVGVRIANRSK
jgi:hypothetical protein